jgi:hypothetical protein
MLGISRTNERDWVRSGREASVGVGAVALADELHDFWRRFQNRGVGVRLLWRWCSRGESLSQTALHPEPTFFDPEEQLLWSVWAIIKRSQEKTLGQLLGQSIGNWAKENIIIARWGELQVALARLQLHRRRVIGFSWRGGVRWVPAERCQQHEANVVEYRQAEESGDNFWADDG